MSILFHPFFTLRSFLRRSFHLQIVFPSNVFFTTQFRQSFSSLLMLMHTQQITWVISSYDRKQQESDKKETRKISSWEEISLWTFFILFYMYLRSSFSFNTPSSCNIWSWLYFHTVCHFIQFSCSLSTEDGRQKHPTYMVVWRRCVSTCL